MCKAVFLTTELFSGDTAAVVVDVIRNRDIRVRNTLELRLGLGLD